MASLCVVRRWALFCWAFFLILLLLVLPFYMCVSLRIFTSFYPCHVQRNAENVCMCMYEEWEKKIIIRTNTEILWHVAVKWYLLTAQNQLSTFTTTQTKQRQQQQQTNRNGDSSTHFFTVEILLLLVLLLCIAAVKLLNLICFGQRCVMSNRSDTDLIRCFFIHTFFCKLFLLIRAWVCVFMIAVFQTILRLRSNFFLHFSHFSLSRITLFSTYYIKYIEQ